MNNLTRRQKRAMYLAFDSLMVPLALYFAYCLRFGSPAPLNHLAAASPTPVILALLGPSVILAFRLPSVKLSTLDLSCMLRILSASVTLAGIAVALSYVLDVQSPRSVPLIFGTAFFALSILGRQFGLAIARASSGVDVGVPVAIYGAGEAGMQLASALRHSKEVNPVLFIDDNPALRNLLAMGLNVHPPKDLEKLVRSGKIERILMAMPSMPKKEMSQLVSSMSGLGVDIQTLPSYVDMISGRENALRTVSPDELLGRNKVDLDVPEIARVYAGRVVMITGAGGSIGSELCQQVLDCRPARLIFYEQSEFALYSVDRDLRPLAEAAGIPVVSRLGSVTNAARVEATMQSERVDIVLHAAAYKHVPLVEDNELEGARNNVLGTQVVAEAAVASGVERVILVSTDKAVRPTNIMGATKRMAELVIHDLQTRSEKTLFSMVRFGNVLGSSGSVLPLFQRQIRAGGPVTVTHPEVTRFFMTIPEAARLVLLAGAYAEGGDVFVLDMGAPVKVLDMAKRMVEMSGAKLRSDAHPEGIEIKVTGLRPGEKLYEELLIDDDSMVGTPHPKILRAEEEHLSQIEVAAMMRELRASLSENDTDRFRQAVQTFVNGYHLQDQEAAQPSIV